jgi:hypothetical protein
MTPINMIRGASIQDMTARKFRIIYNYRGYFGGSSPLRVLATLRLSFCFACSRFDGAALSARPSAPLHPDALGPFYTGGSKSRNVFIWKAVSVP